MLSVPTQLASEQAGVIAAVDTLVAKHGSDRGALIPILSDLRRDGGISDLAMQLVADRLGLRPVEVYGVATFYSFLGVNPSAQVTVRMCRTLSCQMAGAKAVAQALEHELGVSFGQTTEDGQVSLEWTNCIGMCDQAPAMLVNERVFGHLTPESVVRVVREIRSETAQ